MQFPDLGMRGVCMDFIARCARSRGEGAVVKQKTLSPGCECSRLQKTIKSFCSR